MRWSLILRSSTISMFPVPLNSWKISSSMRLPVSISAVATIVREPASSVLRAAAKILRGVSMARASIPPLIVRPPPPIALLNARAVRVMESRRINTCFPASTSCFALDPLVRIDRGQLLKWRETLIFRRLFTIDLQQLDQLRAAAAAPGFTVNPHAVTQGKTANNFGGYKNILRRLHEIALRIAQKSETLAGDFNDTFAEFRFGLNLFATFGSRLSSLASD